jgi:hypothetical protein
MPYRNKCYVCFDGDKDMQYYLLLQAWGANSKIDFDFYDAHELKQARDTSSEETIKRSLRERLNNSREFMVLVGESTKHLYKFVRWEIEVAQSLNLPIIVVNLNGIKRLDAERCPPLVRDALAIHVPFKLEPIRYALKNWPEGSNKHRLKGETGAFYYTDETYAKNGL